MPSQLCMQCVQHLNRAYSFRQLCERSENALRDILGRPIQQTFLELKPLLATETLIANPIPEILTEVTETFPTSLPLNETFTITQNINGISNGLSNPTGNVNITENVNETANVNSLSENGATDNCTPETKGYPRESENSKNSFESNESSKIAVNSKGIIADAKNNETVSRISFKLEDSQIEYDTSKFEICFIHNNM